MGEFIGGKGWMHPEIAVNTHELIFVTAGEVFIEEDGILYHLKAGDLLCLKPNKIHRGYRKSDNARFFWLHFSSDGYEKIGIYNHRTADIHGYVLLFKQLGHLATLEGTSELIECRIAALLLDIMRERDTKSKLFSDICEYIRRNISAPITVRSIADTFCYSSDYLSRVFTKSCGLSLKAYIDAERNTYIKHLLLNTNLTVRQISDKAGFESDNALIKFFKYNNSTTPTAFRNSYYASHTNSK